MEGEHVHAVGDVLQDAAAAVQDLGDRGPAEGQEQHPFPAFACGVAADQVGAGGGCGGDGLAGPGAAEHEQRGRLAVADVLLLARGRERGGHARSVHGPCRVPQASSVIALSRATATGGGDDGGSSSTYWACSPTSA